MKTLISKKKIERKHLEIFKGNYSEFPKGEISDHEEPDFLVRSTCNKIVGIEVTDLYRYPSDNKRPRQANENTWSIIAQRAIDLHCTMNYTPVCANIHFNDGYEIKKKDIEKLTANIVEFVANNTPESDKRLIFRNSVSKQEGLADEINAISILNNPRINRIFYGVPDASYTPDLMPADIERVLCLKNEKHQSYMQNCDIVWLLININCGKMSQLFDVPKKTLFGKYESPFDRVFILSVSENKIFEVNTK